MAKMTNREWINSLDDDEFFKVASEIIRNCNDCIWKPSDCDCSCKEGRTKWLKQEYKEPPKRCSHCGDEAEIIPFNSDTGSTVYEIGCNTLGCIGYHGKHLYNNKEDAIKNWNKRVGKE